MKGLVAAALFALALVPAVAGAGSVGLGLYGGLSAPILYDTASPGTQYGVRVPVNLIPLLTVEPYFDQTSLGDKDETFGGQTYTRSGPDVSTFGANALFNLGMMYPYLGIGSTTFKQSGSDDVTDTCLNFGLGFGFKAMPKLSIDLRAELSAMVTGDTSRKLGYVNLGVSYAVFGF
jgi:Outer membrane protein beta-barrel domain